MRKLTPEECEFIAGGEASSAMYNNEGEIVVTGSPPPYWPPPYYPPPYYPPPPPYWPPPSGGGGSYPPPAPPPDSSSRDVSLAGGLDESELTPAQKEAIEDLEDAVDKMDQWVANLPDDYELILDDGSIITGREVKDAWKNLDIKIHPAGTNHSSGSFSNTQGAVSWNNGNPELNLSVDYLAGRAAVGESELMWLMGHELGHITSDQRAALDRMYADGSISNAERDQHQQMANDVAWAVAQFNGYTVNGGYTYDTDHPTFRDPTP